MNTGINISPIPHKLLAVNVETFGKYRSYYFFIYKYIYSAGYIFLQVPEISLILRRFCKTLLVEEI